MEILIPNETVEKVLYDSKHRNFKGLLPLRCPEIFQYSAFYAFDFSILIVNILSSGFFYSLNVITSFLRM
jgi:hypothetical protein